MGLLTLEFIGQKNVVGAGRLNMFKNSLNRLWLLQDLLSNCRTVVEKNQIIENISSAHRGSKTCGLL